jgi:chromosome segregation ATPase
MHRLKNLNAEQEITVKSLLDEVSRKTTLVEEKDVSISHLNSNVSDLEHWNSGLMTKVEGLLEEKSDGASKAQEFLESLNEAERKNNALLFENAELKSRAKVLEDEINVMSDETKVKKDEMLNCQSNFESRRQQLECELFQMTEMKSDFERSLENAVQQLEKCQEEFSGKEVKWAHVEREFSEKISDFEKREKENGAVSETMRLDNLEFQSRLSRKDAVIEKQEQTISDLKYEIQDVSKRLENLDALKEEKELELGQALQASQALNREIKLEIEQLKLELQEREGSVEREVGTYSEKIRILEEEKKILQTKLETGDKEHVEKQNLEMKSSDLETDKTNIGDQVRMLEDDRNHHIEALQKAEVCLAEKEKSEASLQQTIKESEERLTDVEQKLQTSEKVLKEKEVLEQTLKNSIQELEEKLSHLELNLCSSELELDARNRSSSELEEVVTHLQKKVQDMESKLDVSEMSTLQHGQEVDHLQKSLALAEEKDHTLVEEVEGLRNLVMLLDHEDLEISQVTVSDNFSYVFTAFPCRRFYNIMH